MDWPPVPGDPLPRASLAWFEETKFDWILGEAGHGPEWQRVFHIDRWDSTLVWAAISDGVRRTPVNGVRELGEHGVNCEVQLSLAIGRRRSHVRTIWHYAGPESAPRLVSAFPTP